MDEKGIQRINELAHKAKAEGLTAVMITFRISVQVFFFVFKFMGFLF